MTRAASTGFRAAGEQHPRTVVAVDDHRVVVSDPAVEGADTAEATCRAAYGAEELVLITRQQVNVPRDRQAKFQVKGKRMSIIRQKWNFKLYVITFC
jgi:hypothetical protein